VRVSVGIYTCIEDFKRLACAIKKMRKTCPKKKPCESSEEMVLTIMVKKLC